MRILLIDPPGKNKGLNTGLGYLCAALENAHAARVLDLNNLVIGRCGDANAEIFGDERDRRVSAYLNDFRPELVGISVKSFTAQVAKHLISVIRRTRPGTLCIVGGPHVSLEGGRYVGECGADFGLQGEGEISFPALCDALEAKREIRNIEGLICLREGNVPADRKNGVIEKLDSLPFPNYENFSSVVQNGGRMPEYPLLSSRGCPYACSYCSMPKIMGRKWRFRFPTCVVDELKRARKKYSSTSFTVVDDNLTLNVERVEQICNLLIREQVNLPWNSQNGIRADRVTESLARRMKLSGCSHVWVGIESADEAVFGAIDKGESLADIRKGIRNLQKEGIRVGGFFIVGLPGTTREQDLKIIDFVRFHRIDAFVFNFVPYPGTRASDWVAQHGRLLRDNEGALQYGGNGLEPVFDTPEYSREDRIKTFAEINIRLGYFDRLVDSSLPQREKFNRAWGIVRPYGAKAVWRLFWFAGLHKAARLKHRLAESLGWR